MGTITLNGSSCGTSLNAMLMADDIQPGSAIGYQTCKVIYAYHPIGAKIVEKPITLAQSKPRKISISKAPETMAKEAYEREWRDIGADTHIFNAMRLSRVYGVSSLALLVDGVKSNDTLDWKSLYKKKVSINVFDPLNTAGSLVINQVPNALDFMKTTGRITVGGDTYHPSRTVVIMNEDPLYIEYTTSAFGYVGRSVYQRAFYPLKSFISTMKTDNLVAIKAGLLVAKLEQPGSIVDAIAERMFAIKRNFIKEAVTDNVLSVGKDEDIESLNLQNLEGPLGMARTHILENIAAAADDMPAILLNQETFAQGFGEGSEDAKMVGRYIDRIRTKMDPLYRFFDKLVQYRAWNPEFYKTVQKAFPERYAKIPYEVAFYDWCNSFTAEWPSFLEEPPSEQVKVDDVKLRAIIAMLQILMPEIDVDNKARIIEWACENVNELKQMFGSALEFDYDSLREYTPPEGTGELKEPKVGQAMNDSIAGLRFAVAQLPQRPSRVVGANQHG